MNDGLDLRDLDPGHLDDDLYERNAHTSSDRAIIDGVAQVLARPRLDAPDSFILHAPLELLARAALLPSVSPGHRGAARRQIVTIAARFEAFGPSVDAVDGAEIQDPVAALLDAIGNGDLHAAASAGFAAGLSLDADLLSQAVTDGLASSLAAAAHAPIFLHHLPHAAPRSPLAGAMFGTLAREVARHPDWALTWMDDESPGGSRSDLARALADTPVLGPPGSTFIRPLMAQAESSGLAAHIVGRAVGPRTEMVQATQAILRIATASMLLDDPTHAPYGWSHCLTIPQGLLSVAHHAADPLRMVAIAATHVVGFRAGEGSAPLSELAGGRLGDSGVLAGAQRPTADELQRAIDHAATQEDAHLAKYVVSCLDAARTDPDGAAQHLRAAVYLSDWWRDRCP
ncbi:MAG: hypothetical protein OSA99_00485 [Acidimicrobiales bacterium]|nr:hypothetical protein [Acidimicrobiales bacterium]